MLYNISMNSLKLRNNLKNIRFEKKLSQEDLAKLVGVSRQTINAIESEDYNPSTTLAFTIATKLKMDINLIFYLGKDE